MYKKPCEKICMTVRFNTKSMVHKKKKLKFITCCVEDTAKRIKRQTIILEKVFEKHACDKGLITQNILKMFKTQ